MAGGRGMGMGTMRAKLKRKDAEELDQVSHDFSDFSLSSPARKIRRLVHLPIFLLRRLLLATFHL